MGLIDPEWYAARSDEEKQALRNAFAEKPANELDVAVNSLALLQCIERLLAVIMMMDGQNMKSIEAVAEAYAALKTASGVTFSISTDDVVKGIWGAASSEGISGNAGGADE